MISGTDPVYRRFKSLKLFNVSLVRKRMERDFFYRRNNFDFRFFRNVIQVINSRLCELDIECLQSYFSELDK